MESTKLKLLSLIYTEPLKKADAIICLEGDGQHRTRKTLELFKNKIAPTIVVSGGLNSLPFSIPADKMAAYLIKKGVPKHKIIIELKSQNTREQAEEVMKLVKEKKWKKIILVASHFHQLRAYLTFLKAMEEARLKISIINVTAESLPWFGKTLIGKSRMEIFDEELKKINKYRGNIMSVKKAFEYQIWKEKQLQ